MFCIAGPQRPPSIEIHADTDQCGAGFIHIPVFEHAMGFNIF